MTKNMALTCSRVRPVRITRYRNKEALCITRDEFGCEDSEWLDVEDLEVTEEAKNQINHSTESSMPVIDDLKNWIISPWSTDE